VYLDLIKGYRVTIGGYNAPLKEHRENTVHVCVRVSVFRALNIRTRSDANGSLRLDMSLFKDFQDVCIYSLLSSKAPPPSHIPCF